MPIFHNIPETTKLVLFNRDNLLSWSSFFNFYDYCSNDLRDGPLFFSGGIVIFRMQEIFSTND